MGIAIVIRQKVVLSINGNACHAGENAYAALSTKLRGLSYVGTTYGVS